MPERFLSAPTARLWRALRLLLVLALPATLSACTEELVGGSGCPLLCPQQQAPFRDTVIEAIAFDTTVGPFPLLGVSGGALLAARGDTLATHVVVRFDNLPSIYSPNGAAINEEITAIDSTVLRFFVDTLNSRSASPFTIEVFDVDTTESDSVAAVVRGLFRDDRKLSEVTIDPAAIVDSLRIPLPDSFVLARILDRARVRVGLRIRPTDNAQLRLGAIVSGQPAPRLTFDPSTDTTFLPLDVTPATTLPGAELDDVLRLAYTVYTLTERGTPPPPAGTLVAGGWPSRRAYLRFEIPSFILDSSTVVRAELLLTQRPSSGPDRGDSIGVQPYVGVSTSAVTDPYFATVLAANGRLAGVDSLRLVPRDSGQRAFNIVSVVRGWAALNPDVTRFVALQMNGEGSLANELLFHDRSAPPALRPRLRVTFLPRTEFTLP